VDSAARTPTYSCEPLEQRVLLDASDAVLVLIEPVQELGDIHTLPSVEPYLWHNPLENAWDPYGWNNSPTPSWANLEDHDGNNLPGDYFGWNFVTNTPNFIFATEHNAAHGKIVTDNVLNVLNSFNSPLATHVKIMYVFKGTRPFK
jgi:hypothetical protein